MYLNGIIQLCIFVHATCQYVLLAQLFVRAKFEANLGWYQRQQIALCKISNKFANQNYEHDHFFHECQGLSQSCWRGHKGLLKRLP